MPFANEQELKDFIEANIIQNDNKEISGLEVREALLGIMELVIPKTTSDVTANLGSGGSVGGVQTNDVFIKGTPIEDIVRKLIQKGVAPTYIQPQISLTTSITSLIQEVGTIISPQFGIGFIQNDAGGLIAQTLRKNGTIISTSPIYTESNLELTEVELLYQASVSYAQGACKLNNLNIQDCSGRVVAGTINSNSFLYKGVRRLFYGTPVASVTNSSQVRSLTNNISNPQVGMSFTINIPAGSNRVVFAYPETLPDPSFVKYREFANTDIKQNFTKTTFNVEGANGYNPILYKVFEYVPVEPFPYQATYDVTL